MRSATPRHSIMPLYSNIKLFQHEVFNIKKTLDAGSLCSRHVNHGNTSMFFYFLDNRHKIVEFFALLQTELSSYKIYKVSMLFCIQFALNLKRVVKRF